MELVAVGFLALFVLLFLEVPIAWGLLLVGFTGFAVLVGVDPALSMLGTLASRTLMSYDLSIIPLFLLMGNFVARSGISRELYSAANAFIGHRRGGLAMATVVACGGFSAVCGSSLATAATMGKIAMPAMRRYGYDDRLAAGSVAAGGTLGILIPPSVLLVLYGLMTDTDIGALFIAGLLPGLLGIILYVGAIGVAVRIDPTQGPAGDNLSWSQRLRALKGVWGMLLLFVLVMGGIYFGVFTPTEAAGIGASGAFLIALARRTLTWRLVYETLVETARTSAVLLILFVGALVFSNFVNVGGLPNALVDLVEGLELGPVAVILALMVVYVTLGCVFESFSMMLLTVPIFHPIASGLGFDSVWFGILVAIVIEISLITPPIGMNVFVMNAMYPDLRAGTIFRGVIPFVLADLVRLGLLIWLPAIALYLPRLMG